MVPSPTESPGTEVNPEYLVAATAGSASAISMAIAVKTRKTMPLRLDIRGIGQSRSNRRAFELRIGWLKWKRLRFPR